MTLAFATTLVAGLTALGGSTTLVAIPELFPSHVRALGLSIAYAVGVALFGGSTQFVVTWLIAFTGNPAAPALYVVGISVLTLLAILAVRETANKDLEE